MLEQIQTAIHEKIKLYLYKLFVFEYKRIKLLTNSLTEKLILILYYILVLLII